MTDKINKTLDLAPLDDDATKFALPAVAEDKPIESGSDKEQIEDDFDQGRESLHELIRKGHDAIEDMMQVAKQSQHPTAYSTLNSMLKTMADMHKDLLIMHKQKKNLLTTEPGKKNANGEVNNDNRTQNIFVGTTAELSALMNKGNEESSEEEDKDV